MKHTLRIIAAMSRDLAIGRNGDLIWHLREDLRHFKALTLGHTVIMGRKTWQSLPKGALPGRQNIVISRNPDFSAPGALVCSSLQEALDKADTPEPFIIGGGEIYRLALPLARQLHITLIEAEYPDADTLFPRISEDEFSLTDSSEMYTDPSSSLTYRFLTYTRR